MIDVNKEAEKSLSKVDCEAVYYYPDDFNTLPVISYYQLTERPSFGYDNIEAIQTGTVVVDVWSNKPSEVGAISLQVNDVMVADGWGREFSRDVNPDGKPGEDYVYHKTMRFSKNLNVD